MKLLFWQLFKILRYLFFYFLYRHILVIFLYLEFYQKKWSQIKRAQTLRPYNNPNTNYFLSFRRLKTPKKANRTAALAGANTLLTVIPLIAKPVTRAILLKFIGKSSK